MTVIRPNSVSGINSITAQADEIKVFKSDGTQGGLIIGGANLNATSGISTLLALNVTGNVSIAGTLTYQDVTNIDSVGIITARTGIDVIAGDLVIPDSIIHRGDTNTKIRFPDADAFSVETAGSEVFRLTSDRKVGINRTSPARHLHAYAPGAGFVAKFEGAFSYSSVEFADNGTTNAPYIGSKNDDFTIATGGNNERVRITSAGNVGIGTTNPQAKLTVSSTSPAVCDIHHIDGGTGDEARIILGALAGNPPSNRGAGIAAVNNGAGHDLIIKCSASHGAGPSEKFRATSSGKFGFGTDSPDQTVHILKGSAGSIDSTATSVLTLENSTTAVLQFLTPNNASAQLRFGDPQDNGAGFIDYSHSANTMSFGVYGPTRMQLDSNGHLGIDVASTTQLANSKMLTLRPTDDDGIRFVRPGDGNNVPNVHLDVTTTTSGSALRSGGEAYTTKYHTYNCDMLFRSYLGGGTGGIIRFVTSDTDAGTQNFWQIDEKGMTTHRSRSSTVKTHEFTYTGGAGGGTLNVNLLSISGYVASSTAVVKIEYVGMYGLAGSYISQGIWLCSYRRANGGSAANALAQQTHNSGSNSASNVTMAWVGDNLRLTVGAYTGFTVHVTATVYNATINVLV